MDSTWPYDLVVEVVTLVGDRPYDYDSQYPDIVT